MNDGRWWRGVGRREEAVNWGQSDDFEKFMEFGVKLWVAFEIFRNPPILLDLMLIVTSHYFPLTIKFLYPLNQIYRKFRCTLIKLKNLQ